MKNAARHTLPEDVAVKLTALRAPMFHALSWKVQTIIRERAYDKGKRFALMVAYLDARDVQERLDNVAGFDWSAEYKITETPGKNLLVVECELTVFGVTRRDVGSVDANNANAYKSAYSDALKRAAVHFGVGRFVYRLPLLEVEVDISTNAAGKESARPKRQAQKELEQVTKALLKGEKMPAVGMIRVLSEVQREELPGFDPDSVDSEAGEYGEQEVDRTLNGRECAALLAKVRDSGIDEATLIKIGTEGFKRELTSLKDIKLSEQEQLLAFARVYWQTYLDPKRQQAAN